MYSEKPTAKAGEGRPTTSHSSISLKSVSQVPIREPTPPKPSLRLLYSFLTPRQCLQFLAPALLASVIAGGIAPFMTYIVGEVFDTFGHFPIEQPSPDDKRRLLRDIGISCLQLVALGIGSFVLSSITSCLWIWTAERNILEIRKYVYHAVSHKEMEWFDSRTQDAADDDVPLGPAGLMAKFTRETNEIRSASSLAAGMLVQYLTTCLTCLILAFLRSWALTLVILSAVPVLFIIQAVSQICAGPLVDVDRKHSAKAATLIERVITAIATVKAFNATDFELGRLSQTLDHLVSITLKLNGLWGFTSGLSQFTMMAMFVQGFWFGSKLVKDGHINAGDVMAVFWACLIATSNFQMCIPQFITLNKGKFAISAILTVAGSPPTNHSSSKPRSLRKIHPDRCSGEISIENVSFAYPTRPTVPVLHDVSIFVPANEMTFIVGGSGSGKSTLAQLLLHLYEPTEGQILFEDNLLHMLDDQWIRSHVASVSQECILFDMSLHDNVALGLVGSGRHPKDATRSEIIAACTAALMHGFIRDLPDGYDTLLGTNGSNLSGGQRQRLAIARALLRNPSVLILDEATSALDPTSRVLVFEAIKHARQGKTTIVITHDLSQVNTDDFVYVLKDGVLVEQGYRPDLEDTDGEFRRMVDAQADNGGCLPSKDLSSDTDVCFNESQTDPTLLPATSQVLFLETSVPRASVRPGTWMLDVVADLVSPAGAPPPGQSIDKKQMEQRERSHIRPLSIQLPSPSAESITYSRRFSLPYTPTSTSFTDCSTLHLKHYPSMEISAQRREPRKRIRWDSTNNLSVISDDDNAAKPTSSPSSGSHRPSVLQTMKQVFRGVPHKLYLWIGLATCLCSGAMTPIFSFLLSRLMFEVSIGVQNISTINLFGGIVLAIAALDGVFLGLKFFIMESVAMSWITSIRNQGLTRILAQDKQWFDQSSNAPVHIVQRLIQDGDEARVLLSVVVGQFLVVFAMLAVGLVWAMVQGWQLTLVGFAIAPIFAFTMAIQAKLVGRVEFQNKQAREKVAQCYYETVSSIRAIRSMALDSIFQEQYDKAVHEAMVTGNRGGKLEGISFGFASGLIYLSEALLFYVGAVLISRGTYTYLQMIQTLNLLLFTVTIGSQLLAFTQRIARSYQGTQGIHQLLELAEKGDEHKGVLRPANMSNIVFHDVHFSYPTRSDVPVLSGVNFDVCDETVAIVGASGSGKSTLAALLQRLYEPEQGTVCVGANDVRSIDVRHLRDAIGVVSQHPYLFDSSVRDNIAYGDDTLTDEDVRRAAKAAHVHDFIEQLPQGYSTHIGENASLISGGQAQRIAIARALARTCSILILDECTSALDAENQRAILETIRSVAAGRTTLMITHKLPVMKMCDRILVLQEGEVVEQGSYNSLIQQNGVFASLTSAGEWSG